MASRCRCPPLNRDVGTLAGTRSCCRSSLDGMGLACSLPEDFANSMFAIGESSSNKANDWKTTPAFPDTALPPSTWICPFHLMPSETGPSNPAIIRSKIDFPTPLGPTISEISPTGNSALVPLSKCCVPAQTLMLESEIPVPLVGADCETLLDFRCVGLMFNCDPSPERKELSCNL